VLTSCGTVSYSRRTRASLCLLGKSVDSAANGFSQVVLQLISDVTATLLQWRMHNCYVTGCDL
jgi:hypothetical protein